MWRIMSSDYLFQMWESWEMMRRGEHMSVEIQVPVARQDRTTEDEVFRQEAMSQLGLSARLRDASMFVEDQVESVLNESRISQCRLTKRS